MFLGKTYSSERLGWFFTTHIYWNGLTPPSRNFRLDQQNLLAISTNEWWVSKILGVKPFWFCLTNQNWDTMHPCISFGYWKKSSSGWHIFFSHENIWWLFSLLNTKDLAQLLGIWWCNRPSCAPRQEVTVEMAVKMFVPWAKKDECNHRQRLRKLKEKHTPTWVWRSENCLYFQKIIIIFFFFMSIYWIILGIIGVYQLLMKPIWFCRYW